MSKTEKGRKRQKKTLMAIASIFVFVACTSETAGGDTTFTSTSGYLYSDDVNIQTEESGTSPSLSNDERIEPSDMLVDPITLQVPLYDQTVLFPTGCEAVATVATLGYLGYDITVDDFIDNHLKTGGAYCDCGKHSNVFDCHFVGNPRSVNGFLCYPEVICNAVSDFFSDTGETMFSAADMTGADFKTLIDGVVAGSPAIIWVTETYEPTKWTSYHGSSYASKNHCVVLSGVDRYNGRVTITDSIKGKLDLPYEQVENVYEFCGKKAVVINKRS